MQSIHHHDERGMASPDDYRTTTRDRSWDISPTQIVSLVVGAGFLVVGTIALARAGLDTPLSDPVVDVAGYSHTAWLGIVEIGVGVLFLLAATDPFAKGGSAVLGALLVIAGVLIRAIPEDLPEELGIEQSMGTPLIIIGAIVALTALLLPVWRGRTVEREVDVR